MITQLSTYNDFLPKGTMSDRSALARQFAWFKRGAVIAILCIIGNMQVSAQEMDVPVDVQMGLFHKILGFAHSLKTLHTQEYVIGIVYQSSFRASTEVKNQILALKNVPQVQGLPVRYVAIRIESGSKIGTLLSTANIDAAYITPLRAVDISEIAQTCQASQTVSLTGVPTYIEEGLSIGVSLRSAKPLILVNLTSARAEGLKLSSNVLALAKVVQ